MTNDKGTPEWDGAINSNDLYNENIVLKMPAVEFMLKMYCIQPTGILLWHIKRAANGSVMDELEITRKVIGILSPRRCKQMTNNVKPSDTLRQMVAANQKLSWLGVFADEMARLEEQVAELQGWLERVEDAKEDREMLRRLLVAGFEYDGFCTATSSHKERRV